MRVDHLKIRGFKNLEDVDIDFDQDSLETVLIGQNGSGKSNVIEALATIFRDLDSQRPGRGFDYFIAYDCKDHRVEIDQGYTETGKSIVRIDGNESTLGRLRGGNGAYLPNHVFGYYSGRSERLTTARRRRSPPRRSCARRCAPRSHGSARLLSTPERSLGAARASGHSLYLRYT
jgi:hypothetical protein